TSDNFLLSSRVGYQQNRLFDIQNKRSYPRGESAINSNINRIRDESFTKVLSVSSIENKCVVLIRHIFEFLRRKSSHSSIHHYIQAFVTFDVQHNVFREISRRWQKSVSYFFDELLFGHFLKSVVSLLLISECVKSLFAHIFPTSRTCSVSRINDNVVFQRHYFIAKRIIQITR